MELKNITEKIVEEAFAKKIAVLDEIKNNKYTKWVFTHENATAEQATIEPDSVAAAGSDLVRADGLSGKAAQELFQTFPWTFEPNRGRTFTTTKNCGTRVPSGCGCYNGDKTVPVLSQVIVRSNRCSCTYMLPGTSWGTIESTIGIQTICD